MSSSILSDERDNDHDGARNCIHNNQIARAMSMQWTTEGGGPSEYDNCVDFHGGGMPEDDDEEDDDDKDNKAENDNSSSSTLQTPCVASRGGSNNINWVEEEVGRGSECDTEMVKSIKCVLAEW